MRDEEQVIDEGCTARIGLVTRLMGNIEEFYVLQEQISDIMAEDESSRIKLTELLGSIIGALRFEQSFTGKESPTILEK